jgi:hypothetical protein
MVMLIGHLSDLFTLVGDVIIAYAVIAVNDRIREEHKIDDRVYNSMMRERRLILFGVVVLFIGFGLRVVERVIS